MSAQVFCHRHRVGYAECTVGNHIYYARYLDLLEEARGEFFRALSLTLLELQQRDLIFPVVECQIQYRAPARYDDVLAIEVRLTELGRVKLRFGYRVLNQDNTLVVEASTTHACTSAHGKLKRLPAELTLALEPHLRPASGPPYHRVSRA